MNVTDIVDRLGHPDRVDWDDPVVLTYGDGNVRVPRDGSYLMAAAPDLDALVALLQRTPQPTQYPAEGEPAPRLMSRPSRQSRTRTRRPRTLTR